MRLLSNLFSSPSSKFICCNIIIFTKRRRSDAINAFPSTYTPGNELIVYDTYKHSFFLLCARRLLSEHEYTYIIITTSSFFEPYTKDFIDHRDKCGAKI